VTIGQSGAGRNLDESETYVARNRDGKRLVVEVWTECRDKNAGHNVLAELEHQAEKVLAAPLMPAEAHIAEHLGEPIEIGSPC
jgi:hypothetical protein